MKSTKRPAIYDDLTRVPEHMVAEIIDGELIATPRPASPHAYATSMLAGDLIGSFGNPPPGAAAPGGWWILFEPELHFGADVIVPDLAGWKRERMPRMPDVAAFQLAPDWVCEVVSPQTASTDRIRKMRVYGREGVRHLWLVDPLARTLEVFRLDEPRWVVASTHSETESVRAEPFEAIELDLTRLWLPA